jgi:putative transposase
MFVTAATAHPNAEWVVEQADAFCAYTETQGDKIEIVFHDRDAKLTREFDERLQSRGIAVKRLRPLSPNLNAFIERWIQSVKQECLDHFIVLGQTHLNHPVSEYVQHYQTERPHQGLNNSVLVPMKPPDESVPVPDQLVCHKRLGGLLKS